MEILATNRGHKPKSQDIWDRLNDGYTLFLVFVLLGCTVMFIILIWRCLTVPNPAPGVRWIWIILIPVLFLFLDMGLFILDNYLRSRRAVETAWIPNETLIIECHNCIFRRRKEIPLSSIQSVEPISESIGGVYYRADRPERLRIIYSHRRHYRFGLCMTDTDREALAKKIMDLRKVKTIK